MSENHTTVNSKGIGFIGMLTIAFIVLKLTHVIDWSWIWVLSPIWICILGYVVLIGGIIKFLTSVNKPKKRKSKDA